MRRLSKAADATPTFRSVNGANAAAALNAEELDSVRRFSSELRGKPLDELKSSKIIESDSGGSGPSSLLSTDSGGGSVHKYNVSAAAARATAVDESALFQSLGGNSIALHLFPPFFGPLFGPLCSPFLRAAR